MTPPRASDTAPSLLVVASEYLRAQAPSTPRIVYSVPIGVAGAKAIADHSASPRMPGVPSRMERDSGCVTAAFLRCRSAVEGRLRGGERLALVPCGSLGDRRRTRAINAKQLGHVGRSARFPSNSAIEATWARS